MNVSFLQVMVFLLAGITVIILLTAKFRVHAFFALMIACFITGLGVSMGMTNVITVIKDGFGNIMRSLGFIIVLGTALGILLEHTGSTKVMAGYILKKVGERNAALALSITGFIVGLPVFCDSGYIVLSGLNKSLSKKTGASIVVTSVSLATGLLAVHCLLPPHPGAAAAAGTIGADIGKLISYGIIIAVPAMVVGHLWARYAGNKIEYAIIEEDEIPEDKTAHPSVIKAFLPVIVPILLIAAASFFNEFALTNDWIKNWFVLGDPVVALSAGILLAFNAKKKWNKKTVSLLLQESAEKAGGILVIIGAGGAFGAVLAATKIGDHFSAAFTLNTLGILFPFLLTFILKTAQGSSTVAIITAASIVQPLLPALGLNTEAGKLIAVLAMGAGSMMISHANDAYFWVITKFSGIEMKAMLRVYSTATIFMGLVTLLMVYILSLFIL
ncbi:GntP family permease [Panacibacter ginsenosidivorans]|uniref:GntP family permease n=1 Tax=Panacibacter ginsenosidivorans TaxID=1813871 RepID=A0A5B8V859_9BACT|nr:GntP family permease [Panacibacter ginsenosidivorans]QEC67720.1 GntP family permease [Panacibacter ginsenosidivorans]